MLKKILPYFLWVLLLVLIGLGTQFLIQKKTPKLHYDLQSSYFWKAYPEKIKSFHEQISNIPELNQKANFLDLSQKKVIDFFKQKTWVESAQVKKTFLGQVYLRVKVAEPRFLWVKKHKSELVSAKGVSVAQVSSNQWPDLPIVRGSWEKEDFQKLNLLMQEFENMPEFLNHKAVSEVWSQNQYWKIQMNEAYQIYIPKTDFKKRLLRIKEVYKYLRGKNISFSLLASRFDKKVLARK